MSLRDIVPINRIKLSDEVHQRLLQMIKDETFYPGEKLPSEMELSKILGVSRTALREGLKSLSGMNILSIQHGKGIFVVKNPDIIVEEEALAAILESETFENMIQLRATIDIGIARYAALKAKDEDIEAMNNGIILMEKTTNTNPPNWEFFHEGDKQFHYALCKATQNPMFEKVGWPLVKYTMKRAWKKLEKKSEYFKLAFEQHKNILVAVKNMDVQESMNSMMSHLDSAFDLALKD